MSQPFASGSPEPAVCLAFIVPNRKVKVTEKCKLTRKLTLHQANGDLVTQIQVSTFSMASLFYSLQIYSSDLSLQFISKTLFLQNRTQSKKTTSILQYNAPLSKPTQNLPHWFQR